MANFTNKEMLTRIMNKLDIIERKGYETHELAKITNGKVKLHTKMIWGIAGAGITISLTFVGWLIKYL